jgi:hypothetical protein
MKKIITIAIFIALSTLALAGPGQEPPTTISYQGILTDENGEKVSDGSYTATFTLFDLETNGVEQWSDEISFDTEDGVFNIELGANPTTFASENTSFVNNLWLEIHLQGEVNPLDPRIKITLVPYAYNALAITGGTIEDTPIGNTTAAAATFTTLQITGGTPGDGEVLTSDANGNATWEAAGGGGGSSTFLLSFSGSNQNASTTYHIFSGGALNSSSNNDQSRLVMPHSGSIIGYTIATENAAGSSTFYPTVNGEVQDNDIIDINSANSSNVGAFENVTYQAGDYISLYMEYAQNAGNVAFILILEK